MTTKYKLIYFDGKGRAEAIRMLFHFGGQEFEDFRFKFPEFPEIKKSIPFGSVPVLEIDGVQYCQSKAIERYLASQFGLYGSTPLEKLKMDQIADCLEDWLVLFGPTFRMKDEKEKKEAREKLMAEKGEKMMMDIEKMLGSNGTAVGDKVSWIDILVYTRVSMMPGIDYITLDVEKTYPNMGKIAKKMAEHPKVKEYVAKSAK